MTRVVVYIDKLVLRGINRAEAPAISAGIEAQLQQMLVAPGMAESLVEAGDRHRIKAGPVDFSKAGGARQLGRKAGIGIVKGVTS